MWFVYSNGAGTYTVAQQPSAMFMFPVIGPVTWDQAWAWMRANGHAK